MKNNKSKYHRRSGFKLPENYFQEFEMQIMDTVSAEKADSFPQMTSGFKVPEGYFEKFEDRLLEKIDSPKVISLFRKRKFYYAAAIAATFIGIVSTLLLNPFGKETTNSAEVAAIEQYIDDGNLDFNSDDISTFMYDQGYVIDNISNTGINDEVVVDYLNENVEDPTLIFQ